MVLAIVFFYLFLIGFIAYWCHRSETADDFLIGGRSAGTLQVGAGLFTLIGGGEFVTMATLGLLYGLAGSALFIGYSAGFILLGALAPTIRKDAASRNFISLPDFIYENYGLLSGVIVSIFSFAAFFALLMLQFSAASTVLSAVTPISYDTWAAMIMISIVLYLLIGGLRAVLVTDVVQGVAMCALLPFSLFAAFNGVPTKAESWFGTEKLGILGFAGFFVTGFLVAVASADVWQRAFAAKSDRHARRGFYLGGFMFIVYGFALTLFGIAAAKLGVKDPNLAFVEVVTTQFGHSALLLGASVLLVTAAISSTADTELFLLTGMINHELIRHRVLPKTSFLLADANGTRVALVFVAVAAFAAAAFFKDLVEIYTWLLSALIVLSPAIMFSLFIPTSKTGMAVSLMGNALLFALLVYGGVITLENVWWIAAPGVLLYLATLPFRNRQKDTSLSTTEV